MPQSEVNAPAHLQDRKIKENLDYTVVSLLDFKNADFFSVWEKEEVTMMKNRTAIMAIFLMLQFFVESCPTMVGGNGNCLFALYY